MAKTTERCSFCGRDKKDTNMLIAGLNAHICDYCVLQAKEIISEEINSEKNIDFHDSDLLKPIEIKKYLDRYVIGQDDAKKVLSVAVYNLYKRLTHIQKHKDGDIEIEKSN